MLNMGLHLQKHFEKRMLSFWGPEVDATVVKIYVDKR
jgi:hypothetical protein